MTGLVYNMGQVLLHRQPARRASGVVRVPTLLMDCSRVEQGKSCFSQAVHIQESFVVQCGCLMRAHIPSEAK